MGGAFCPVNVAYARPKPGRLLNLKGDYIMSKIENSELYMSREDFKNVLDDYIRKPMFIGMDGADLEYVFYLVEDLLRREKRALEMNDPYATRAIDNLATAAWEVSHMANDVADAFEEVYKKNV